MLHTVSIEKSVTHFHIPQKKHSFINAFFEWSVNQDQEHHIAWTAICLMATTAVFFPLTMAFILFNGANFLLIIPAMLALVMVVVLNLASLPTRYTIPALVVAIIIDVCVMTTSLLIR